MSQKADPFKVGSFVVAGVMLLVIVVLVLGSGKLFRHEVPFVLYFADSVNGLVVGSPVKFKGVSIGTVKRIQVALDPDRGIQYIPIAIEVDNDLIRSALGESLDIDQQEFVRTQVARGLRASLEVESFLTGRLYVQFDYYTNAPPPVYVQKAGPHLEIPTISTGLSEFIRSLERVDLPGLSRQVSEVLTALSEVVSKAKLGEISDRLSGALEAVESLARSPEVRHTIRSLGDTSDEARRLFAELRREIQPVAGGVTNVTSSATQTLEQLQSTLVELRQTLSPESPLVAELNRTLEEFAETARAIRRLSESLERNPQAILTGRPPPEKQP